MTANEHEMIETILDQVNNAIGRFVAKNPSLRNDRDDLVQDVFLKILPRINKDDFTLLQCRAFAHQATTWVCYTALRKYKVSVPNDDQKMIHKHRAPGSPWIAFCSTAEILSGLLYDRVIIDWGHVEKIVKENEPLFEWYRVEKNAEVSESLRKQIIAKFEFIT